MILLELFWSFVKIGFTSFGGLSMIPLITDEMLTNNWMSASEVSDIVAIAEMTPGPVGLNCATFAGIRTAGIVGAIIANIGVLTPTFTVCALIAFFFKYFKNSKYLQYAMVGIRPTCLGLVCGILITLSMSNYFPAYRIDPISIGIGILDVFLLFKCKFSIPKVIIISAILGILMFKVIAI